MTRPPDGEAPDTPVWPVSVSNAVTAAGLVGYGLALAASVFAFVGHGLSPGRAFLDGLIVLALFAVPSVLAMLSRPKRPLMLLAAGMTALLGFFGMGSILGLPLFGLGLIWLWAYLKLAPANRWLAKASMTLVPLLWLGATAVLWVHLDPACEQTLRDGSVIEVDPATRGFESGWTWEVGSSFSGHSGPTSDDVVFEACTSNTLVLWEATSALVLCWTAVLTGFKLATRSPTDSAPRPSTRPAT
jgi:hypothetical protein